MQVFTLENKPANMDSYRKTSTVQLHWVDEPFVVEMREGWKKVTPDTVADWDGGYYVAYPDDGSKAYPVSKAFADGNYKKCKATTAT